MTGNKSFIKLCTTSQILIVPISSLNIFKNVFPDTLQVKMLVLLGEVGGIEEYEVVQALKTKRIVKPIVAWCIGTCAGECQVLAD